MCEKCGLEVDCRFDRCRYGLRECGARKSLNKGLLLQKPWRVATTLRRLEEPLSRRCGNRKGK
eukprot:5449397-Heterocapsa_arctica.AAC.1